QRARLDRRRGHRPRHRRLRWRTCPGGQRTAVARRSDREPPRRLLLPRPTPPRLMSRRRATATALLGLALAGCGGSIRVTAPLGRSIAAGPPRPAPVAPTPAPVGDPPAERGGTIPAGAQTAEDSVSRAGVANSPQMALRRYALGYVNWHASGLQEREQQLVAMSIGAAKLTAAQTAAARSSVAALIASHVA